jgi:hypothetical protein
VWLCLSQEEKYVNSLRVLPSRRATLENCLC